MNTVFIFSDQQERRSLLRSIIEGQTDISCIGDSDANYVQNYSPGVVPDLILFDIEYVDAHHLTAISELITKFRGIGMLLLANIISDKLLFESIKVGVNGCVGRDISASKLIETILEITSGGSRLDTNLTRAMFEVIRNEGARYDRVSAELSKREREIVQLLVGGLSHKMIASELDISAFTVSNHVKKIFRKLDAHNVSEVIGIMTNRQLV